MESIQISAQQARVFSLLKAVALESNSPAQCWLTNREIELRLKDVNLRTIRLHTSKLAKLGVFEEAVVFPAHKYRVSDKAQQLNPSYLARLAEAAKLHGVDL
jgi:hypothetical protein